MDQLEGEAKSRAQSVLRRGFSSFTAFCGLLDIIPKDGRRQKLVLNPIQRLYCENHTARDIILKPRRIGMTTEEQARDVWHFLTRPGARVKVMCQSISDQESTERELARVFKTMFESLGELGLGLPFAKSPSGVWELPDRDAVLSVVVAGASEASAQKKGRGGNITRLHVTEQAFWEYAATSLNAVEECVSPVEDGGEIVKESTPKGVGGKFYEDVMAAERRTSGFRLHFFPWYLDPTYRAPLEQGEVVEPRGERELALAAAGVTPEQLKWRRLKIGAKGSEDLIDQEYPSDPHSCFLLPGGRFFPVDILERLRRQKREPIERRPITREGSKGELRIFRLPKQGAKYVLSGDPSEGVPGGHPAAATLFERGTGEHVATIWGQISPAALARETADLGRRYNGATIAPERNNHGHAFIVVLTREIRYGSDGNGRLFRDTDKKLGWLESGVSRSKMLDDWRDDVVKGLWSSPDEALLNEMQRFVIGSDGVPRAAPGATDDLVLSAGIGQAVLRRPEPQRESGHAHDLGIL